MEDNAVLLHDAIVAVIRERGPLPPAEVARRIDAAGTYMRGDGAPLPANQIGARVRKYPHLLFIENGLVHARGGPMLTAAPAANSAFEQIRPSEDGKGQLDLNAFSFRPVADFDSLAPRAQGIYAINLVSPDVLPPPLSDYMAERGHRLLYIGQASTTLAARLAQELRARGHGTFFRSIGAVLGYRPISGSLKDHANKRNYRFSGEDERAIIAWLDRHTEVGWVHPVADLDAAESSLIKTLRPLLNIKGNPRTIPEVLVAREQCRAIACGEAAP